MSGSLLVLGSGGHGRVVADAARAAGYGRIAFLDDKAAPAPGPFPVLGPLSALAELQAEWKSAIVAIGDNRTRLQIFRHLLESGLDVPSILHPSAVVGADVSIGKGVFAAAGAVVNIGAQIHDAVIVNTGATIDHDCVIGAGAHISPGANLGGDIRIDECAWVGIGSAVRNGVCIGRDAIVGAGSAVVDDIPEDTVVAGTPARALSRAGRS